MKVKIWGHSTFRDAVDLEIKTGVKRPGLFHHDPDRNDESVNVQFDICRKYISECGSRLDCFVCADGLLIDV